MERGDLDYSAATVPLLGGIADKNVFSFIDVFGVEL